MGPSSLGGRRSCRILGLPLLVMLLVCCEYYTAGWVWGGVEERTVNSPFGECFGVDFLVAYAGGIAGAGYRSGACLADQLAA